MPSPFITNFTGGVLGTPASGQSDKFRFFSTWVAGDTWSAFVTSTLEGDFTLGVGNIANKMPTCALKLHNRMYLGLNSEFALSSNGDVTAWEEQNSGTALISYLSQFGAQDGVVALSSLTGRLAVFGRQSIQLWGIDADPANFALQQVLDQIGTNSPLSVKATGDLDVLFLHYSGIRSLRANQQFLNASTNDIGTAIDSLIRSALVNYDESVACAIVEPTTRQYWLHINGTIYVLSNYPESKIVAWSTFKPTGEGIAFFPTGLTYSGLTIGAIYFWTRDTDGTTLTNGAQVLTVSGSFIATATTAVEGNAFTGSLAQLDIPFTPEKFIVYNGQVLIRGTDRIIYQYGAEATPYDRCIPTIELPWLDMKDPTTEKQAQGIDVAMSGKWDIQASMNPRYVALTSVVHRGSLVTSNMTSDSTFDIGHFGMPGTGTHLKIKVVGDRAANPMKLSKLAFLYTPINKK